MNEIMIDLQGGAKAPLYEKIYEYIKNYPKSYYALGNVEIITKLYDLIQTLECLPAQSTKLIVDQLLHSL